jgi:AcrR family transcriptional regulator
MFNTGDPMTQKDTILQAAIDILNEVDDIDSVTVRQIAKRAGVGIGLINYHFQTRDNLVNQAIEAIMEALPDLLNGDAPPPTGGPVEQMKQFLKDSSSIVMRYEKFSRTQVYHDLLHGNMQTPLYLVPLLREHFGASRTEQQIRMIALQLVSFTQVAFLRSDMLKIYSGVDIMDDTQRDTMIDFLVDQITH